MQLDCPECSSRILADDINVHTAIAKCRECNAVFGFAHLLEDTRTGAESYYKPPVAMPEGMNVERTGMGLTISRRWFAWSILFLFFFCIAWDSFLVFWYKMAFTTKAPWIMVVFPIAHVAVGVGLTYTVLAGFLNSTVIRVDTREISITHGPLPWPGNRVIAAQEVDQLFCQEKKASESASKYNLCAIFKGGKRTELVTDLETPDQARFMEQQIEDFLRIKDRPVEGELKAV